MEKEVYQQNNERSQNPAEHQEQFTVEKERHQCNAETALQKDSRK
jgi:hypothetical protein